ncbi:M17 family metallopeptidase [Mesomycoplasma neurolyticum]|uniref:Probable cytosol aminopeptidase n=1 Tax=Mesomycoplasma neurolyticum TaxID=2120 RepID=A0A449A6B1_9BACT|nr:M17 family metallopeptidase [Mesomycoplasma neurolyticum]VEU59762.1 Cytosol aminopeptidase [Mesomycoplasma neurolyticum]
MIKFSNKFTKQNITLVAQFKNSNISKEIIQKTFAITEFLNEHKAVIYLGKEKDYNLELLDDLVNKLNSLDRNYDLDLNSFINEKISAELFVKKLYESNLFKNANIFSLKTSKEEEKKTLTIVYDKKDKLKALINESNILMDSVNFARNLQATPPNICNSEWLAETIKEKVNENKEIKVKILNKKEIQDLKMNLLLSVNKGSMFEPRVVVLEYNGNPKSNQKTVLVGKGITFDSGGYNIKTGKHMNGMKYDMSGAAVAASTIKAIADLKIKANFSAVLAITDNRVNGDANLPDAVWKSMNGKTVEINNTDAEGRLVLADGMTYAIQKLNATNIITIATLTGAILVSLGHTFTGAFSTSNELWNKLEESSKIQNELVWRMPLHKDFAKNIRKSAVADLKNTDLSGLGGSISAAMFLKEFSEKTNFMHLDIAGTADIGENPMAPMVKTLVELSKK